MPHSVAFVVSTVGYHWEELYAPYEEFREAGWEVAFFTPEGEQPEPDPVAMTPRPVLSLFGFGMPPRMEPDSELGREIRAGFEAIRPISAIEPDAFDAIYLVGGHGALFDLNGNPELHEAIEGLHREGKVLSGVCHATSSFAHARDDDGEPIVAGKRMTGFSTALDKALVAVGGVDDRFLPLPRDNDRELLEAGAKVSRVMGALNPRWIAVDPPFVTGTGPKAAGRTAREVIRLVEGSPA